MAKYQDVLYAQNTYALLVILQAMDTAGKDGTIRHVMSASIRRHASPFLQSAFGGRTRSRFSLAEHESLAGARRDRVVSEKHRQRLLEAKE